MLFHSKKKKIKDVSSAKMSESLATVEVLTKFTKYIALGFFQAKDAASLVNPLH